MVNVISVLTAILTLLAGIGVFLVACTMMSSNHIQRLALGISTTSSTWRKPFAIYNK